MTYPIYLPGGVEIHSIVRTTTSYLNNDVPISTSLLIDISNGTYNAYIVNGVSVDKIVSANWYPMLQENIVFKMVPYLAHNSSLAVFGIVVLDQESFDYQRGGNVSFRVSNGVVASVPALTFSSSPWLFNPSISPLQSTNSGIFGGGGAH